MVGVRVRESQYSTVSHVACMSWMKHAYYEIIRQCAAIRPVGEDRDIVGRNEELTLSSSFRDLRSMNVRALPSRMKRFVAISNDSAFLGFL